MLETLCTWTLHFHHDYSNTSINTYPRKYLQITLISLSSSTISFMSFYPKRWAMLGYTCSAGCPLSKGSVPSPFWWRPAADGPPETTRSPPRWEPPADSTPSDSIGPSPPPSMTPTCDCRCRTEAERCSSRQWAASPSCPPRFDLRTSWAQTSSVETPSARSAPRESICKDSISG